MPTETQAQKIADETHAETDNAAKDVMLLKRWNGKLLAEKFNLPGMELEIERAVEQVERSILGELESSQKDKASASETQSAKRKDQ